MKNAHLLLALAGLALAACNSGSNSVGARFASPTSIVPFAGNLHKAGGKLRDYLAVSSSRADEVVVVDPSDEQPVLGPGAVFPLSIPTAPRPVKLAAATLGDRADVSGADLLVVVSSGSSLLQLVNTWNPDAARVEPVFQADGTGGSIDLASTPALGPGTEILSVVAFPIPDRDASGAVTVPRARLVAAVSGGRLAVVDFVRGAARQGEDPASPPVVPLSAVAAVQEIGVDALDLAVDPEGTTLFAATRDAVGKDAAGNDVFGVKQIAAARDATLPWSTVGLGANSATLAVAAARVRERRVRTPDPAAPSEFDNSFDTTDPNAPDEFSQAVDADVPLRVYAALDPDSVNGCGPARLISCGVATLEPAAIAPAPAQLAIPKDFATFVLPRLLGGVEPMGFRAPMQLPGVPISIAVALPVAGGAARVTDAQNAATPQNPATPLITVEHGFGPKNTTAVAAVTSADGRVYLLDLGRGAPVNDVSITSSSQPNATAGSTTTPGAASGLTTLLGLSTDFPVDPSVRASTDPAAGPVRVTTDGPAIARVVQVTPGFTGAHDYALTWQGPLPNLTSRRGTLVVDPSVAPPAQPRILVAAQLRTNVSALDSAASWVVGAAVGAPELGVRAGDSVIVECASAAPQEVHVKTVLPGDAPGAPQKQANVAFPGGALELDTAPACASAAVNAGSGAPQDVTLSVRASGLVLTRSPVGLGARSEYAGRPPPFAGGANPPPVTFALEWQDEATLAPNSEALALARLARRTFYPTDPGCALALPGCYAVAPWIVDPLAPGPVVAFKVGLVDTVNPPSTALLARDAQLLFTTTSGFSPAFRRPVSSGVLPRGVVAYDRTKFGGHENDPVRFYATYLDDQLLQFSPAEASGVVRTIR